MVFPRTFSPVDWRRLLLLVAAIQLASAFLFLITVRRPVFDEGAGTLIKPLTWQGDMSFGPPRDGQHTFQRLDLNPRWTGVPDLEDAGPRAITTYLRTYGPATFEHRCPGPGAVGDLRPRLSRATPRSRGIETTREQRFNETRIRYRPAECPHEESS